MTIDEENDNNEMTTIPTIQKTRRELKVMCAKSDISYDELINQLIKDSHDLKKIKRGEKNDKSRKII